MKKLLSLLLVAMLLPMAAGAQLKAPVNQLQRAPYQLKTFTKNMMAPTRATLAADERIMGPYDTDDLSNDGLGITGLPGTIPIATIITPEELAFFQGGQIVRFRVGLCAATKISRVFVAPVSATGAIGTFTEWQCSSNSLGWNEIEIATPYEINLDGNTSLMIGFDYTQTSSNYPISAVMVGDIHTSYCYLQGSWQDVGLSAYGNLSVQCVVQSDNYPEYFVSIGGLYTPGYTKGGTDINYQFNARNLGVSDIAAGNCTFDLLIDGEPVTTFTNPMAIGSSNVTIEGSVPSDGYDYGKHTLTIAVNSINGEPVEDGMALSREFILYEHGFARQMHVVEQFTSTYCTYCPLGNSMLSILTSMRDDIAWVGIHGNMNGTDPMRTLQCDSIMAFHGENSYPSGSFDRTAGFESEDAVTTGLGYYEQYQQEVAEDISAFFDQIGEVPSFATVQINSTYDPETREAVITVNGELTPDFDKMLGADSKLTVYITEDGVVARQLNQGRWIPNYVHNGVMRYALNSVLGNDLNRNGNTYENVFNIIIPEAWNADNLNVVAFINRPLANGQAGKYTDMFINQANKRKLGEFDEPSTMTGDVNMDGEISIADVAKLIDYLIDNSVTPFSAEGADCNGDGVVDIEDAARLIDYLLAGEWVR